MKRIVRISWILLLLMPAIGEAQIITCTTPGQNPSTAFPVCGTSVFNQPSVPNCGDRRVPNPSCSNPLTDRNPFWYKFTCFQTGTLGFLITPNNLSADFDWQIFDITNRNPDEVYTNPSIIVGSNWSGDGGVTGARAGANSLFVCDGLGRPLFSAMPTIVAGREYLLLVSNFASGQNGYKLQFTGGNAVITDSTQPALKRVEANCGGDVLRLKLNKKMKCSSISSNGSEFFVTPSGVVTATSAVADGCGIRFDSDSIIINLNAPLPPGNYELNIRNGADGNTILDYCDKPIPVGNKIPFTILPKAPTPMDSIAPVGCSPSVLRLVFRKPMKCNTVAANGSDFIITGSYPVNITGAVGGDCTASNGDSKTILVTLDAPLLRDGNFTLTLQRGTDGNTILDECSEETPAGSFVLFATKDTVNADFNYTIQLGCDTDTTNYTHPGNNGVNSWRWSLGEGLSSIQQNPRALYKDFLNEKAVQLIVSNGVCADTTTRNVRMPNYFIARIEMDDYYCPTDPVYFSSNSGGTAGYPLSYLWDFGDGATGTRYWEEHSYPVPTQDKIYRIRLTVTDTLGCQKIAQKFITIVRSCFIGVPNAFTPNGDGLNDKLFPMYAIKARNLEFLIYNRWGQLLFKTNDWRNGWDGTFRGQGQDPGTYVWLLRYTDRDTGKFIQQRGTTILIR